MSNKCCCIVFILKDIYVLRFKYDDYIPQSNLVSLSLCVCFSLSVCLSLSVSFCVCVFVSLSLCLSQSVSVSLSLCVSLSLSVSLCVSLSVYLSVCPLCLSVSLSLSLSVSVSFSVCLCLCLSVLSVCLSCQSCLSVWKRYGVLLRDIDRIISRSSNFSRSLLSTDADSPPEKTLSCHREHTTSNVIKLFALYLNCKKSLVTCAL